MANTWDADTVIIAETVGGLLEKQFTALCPLTVELIGEGWDNAAYLVNGEWVFRFPRRKLGAMLIERETRFLPEIAGFLPVPIPAPVFVGVAQGEYPYPFAGYRFLSGTTSDRVEWTESDRSLLAVPLARFLKALHSIPVSVEMRVLAPGDDIGRSDREKRVPWAWMVLERVKPLLTTEVYAKTAAGLEEYGMAEVYSGETVWVHGDFYARHFLVDAKKRMGGVIDWGDMHLGDPALDISIAFSFLPPDAWGDFVGAYGGVEGEMEKRARFRALTYGLLLTEYGVSVGDGAMERAGRYALGGR